MSNKRLKNAEIFRDTQQLYTYESMLVSAIQQSTQNQTFIAEDTVVDIPAPRKTQKAQVVVSRKRSFEAAETYVRQGKKVCVLNFASATNPGGGVANGSSAQEESLCRCSTLYPCLNASVMWQQFYYPHRKVANPLYNNDCIYTPDVYVFKSDIDSPKLLPMNKWWSVNVLSCAAPNLRPNPSNSMNPFAGNVAAKITSDELEALLTSRMRRIFELAAANRDDVLILGAFGCGAFKNPPAIVAKVFKNVMQDFLHHFDTIEYAVYCNEYETSNYDAFCKEFWGV